MQLFLNSKKLDAQLQDNLTRSIVISLFTWRRADDTDELDDDQRFGWWGDTYPQVANDRIGSKLWQYFRRSITSELLTQIEDCARQALQWMLDDNICSSFDVSATRTDTDRVDLAVTLYQGSRVLNYEFKDLSNG